ncbi:MAG TPA: sensor histidine kinase [Gaiellaceae bacterium]|jgi:signal transduction histidine kinase
MTEVSSPLDAVGHLIHGIPDLATPPEVELGLRAIFRDPTLELFWWDWEHERYVDVHWKPHDLRPTDSRVLTMIEYPSRKIGAMLHDQRVLDEPELEPMLGAMRIAMERDRLHRELVEKLDQLQASRQRLVKAADEERRRLERNLHDGAQQRLIVALLGLRGIEKRLSGEPELEPMLQRVREELEGSIEELRELARGLHPPLLAQRGLAAAVRAGAARSSMPVELDLQIDDPLPQAVEAAAYYVCAEAVTNAVKHAQASQVWLSAVHADGLLVVQVRDDGVGGACVECDTDSSGLGGLKDRVEALGGRLQVASPPGGGTTLIARFPV